MAPRMPEVSSVHHVKIPVRDPSVSRDFYGRVLGFEEEIPFIEDGELMGVAMIHRPSGVRYAFRRAPERASALQGFDPVALAVSTRAELDNWVSHLDALGVEHSSIVSGTIGWIVAFDDPDGIQVKLYTLERPSSE